MEVEKKYSAEEILDIIREGVVAPIGTKTFFALMVDEEGKVRMEGTVDNAIVDDIAFLLMRAKRERKNE